MSDTAPKRPAETTTPEDPETLEERIDEGVDESFPASDPPAVHPHERR